MKRKIRYSCRYCLTGKRFGILKDSFHCVFSMVVFLLFLLGGNPSIAEPFDFFLNDPYHVTPVDAVATITMKIQAGYHLYRDRLSLKAVAAEIETTWPPPKEILDPFENEKVMVYEAGEHQIGFRLKQIKTFASPAVIIGYQGCSTQACLLPSEKALPIKIVGDFQENTISDNIAPTKNIGYVTTPAGPFDFSQKMKDQGIVWSLFIAFLGGLLVSFTPCVYPMIPITLSIIGGRKENTSVLRGAALSITYVAGLSMTYALLGLLVASFGAHVRSFIQGAFFQILMAMIFMILAFSMFDLFFLQVPDGVRRRLAGFKSRGISGIFIMGMISGAMASPCVAAPLAGILAFIAASGSVWLGFLMLLSFAWGMGVILIVVGAFSGFLNALPRAGEWMNRVKEFYGFLLLGAALYFAKPLIGAPLVNLAVALLLAAFAGFLGLFSRYSQEPALNERVLKCFGVVALTVGCAFAVSSAAQWGGLCFPQSVGTKSAEAFTRSGLIWHYRLDDGLAQAKREGKPIFLDFRADWCTICREFEENIFPDPQVSEILADFALVRIDATTTTDDVDKLLRRFNVIGLPTLIFMDRNGMENSNLRIVGGTDVKSLSAVLKQALEKK